MIKVGFQMLRIDLLGKTRIEYCGKNLKDKLGHKTIAMIYIMIANKGKYVSKDKLMLYLWPDSSMEAARYNLRYNLWLLKKYLPLDEQGNTLILSDKESCILNTEYPFECDFVTIKELDIKNTDLNTLEQCKKLFRGEIMEGWYLKKCDEFNESILFDRITCEKLHVYLLESLAERYENIGKLGKSLEILQEVARLDPENEKTVLRIMQLYTETGCRAAAIKYYKQFKSILWDNLKISPDESLSGYYNMLISTTGETCNGETYNGEELPCELLLTGICIPDVDFFLMSEIVAEGIKKIKPVHLLELDYNTVVALSYIQNEILTAYRIAGGKSTVDISEFPHIPHVKVLRAFISFIDLIMSHYNLKILIKNSEDMDKMSKKVIEYLKRKNVSIVFNG